MISIHEIQKREVALLFPPALDRLRLPRPLRRTRTRPDGSARSARRRRDRRADATSGSLRRPRRRRRPDAQRGPLGARRAAPRWHPRPRGRGRRGRSARRARPVADRDPSNLRRLQRLRHAARDRPIQAALLPLRRATDADGRRLGRRRLPSRPRGRQRLPRREPPRRDPRLSAELPADPRRRQGEGPQQDPPLGRLRRRSQRADDHEHADQAGAQSAVPARGRHLSAGPTEQGPRRPRPTARVSKRWASPTCAGSRSGPTRAIRRTTGCGSIRRT